MINESTKFMQWRRNRAGELSLYLKVGFGNWQIASSTVYHKPNSGFQVSDGWATYQSLRQQGWLLVNDQEQIIG